MSAPAEYAALLEGRGYVVVYRREASNACPGCGGSNWNIGRVTAECAFCDTAIPIAENRRAVEQSTPAPIEGNPDVQT